MFHQRCIVGRSGVSTHPVYISCEEAVPAAPSRGVAIAFAPIESGLVLIALGLCPHIRSAPLPFRSASLHTESHSTMGSAPPQWSMMTDKSM